MKSIKIDNLRVSYPIVAHSYDEAEKLCPKGWRIPKIWELIKIHTESNLIENYEKGQFRIFWSSTKGEYGVRRLGRCGGGVWFARDDLRGSGSGGRVVFVRRKNEINKERIRNHKRMD